MATRTVKGFVGRKGHILPQDIVLHPWGGYWGPATTGIMHCVNWRHDNPMTIAAIYPGKNRYVSVRKFKKYISNNDTIIYIYGGGDNTYLPSIDIPGDYFNWLSPKMRKDIMTVVQTGSYMEKWNSTADEGVDADDDISDPNSVSAGDIDYY